MARKQPHSVEKLVATQERRNKALEMRLAGMSQAQIAREMGVSRNTVSVWMKKAIGDITRENAEEYLTLELERLDAMHAAIWRKVVKPKNEEERKAQTWNIDRALAIMDQRARLSGSYKHAELKAIADAKGGVSAETASMIGSFFNRLAELVDTEDPATDDDQTEDDPAEEGDTQ